MEDHLGDLPTLVALARSGSMSKAARALGVPRSTVSRRLARLEESIGVPLAERTTRSFRLTEEGRALAEVAALAISRLRTAVETIQHARGEVRGSLRVSLPPGFAGPLLGRFLALLKDRFPGVRVESAVHERPPHLLDAGFDAVFALGPLDDAPWLQHRLGAVWYLLVAHPDYLTARGTPATVEELRDHELLAARTHPIRSDVWPLRDGGGVAVEPRFGSADLAAVVDAVRSAAGIALLPVHLLARELASGELVTVLMDKVGREVDLFLLYAPERRASPLMRGLVDTITAFGERMEQELLRPR